MVKPNLLQLSLRSVLVITLTLPLLVHAGKNSAVPKWQPFEIALKSSVSYTNALQEAEVRALFVSPLGETNRVYGFWDGGKTWRIRYQPSFPGRWRFYTMCSDPANLGLHGQSGEFLCTATKGESRFDIHGPVQVARDQQHLEHADRTSFLWLGDAAWLAAIKSTPADWKEYVQMRAAQQFNVVQWRLHPGGTGEKQTAFTGHERIGINLEFFRQLEAKVFAANRAGLLNAIAPLWEIGDNGSPTLPEDQAVLLLRYAVARWDAADVAWILAFECDSTGAQATRWQNIGRAVFSFVTHAPVVLLPGESHWALDAFRSERWVDVLGLQTTLVTDENSLPWLLNGPLAMERQKLPPKPLISMAPPVEVLAAPNPGQVTADFARRLIWWSVLLNTPAGVSYAAKEVADWNFTPKIAAIKQPWRQALTLPGASAIAPLATCLCNKEFWRMEPYPQALACQPGVQFSTHHIAATRTEPPDMFMFYIPEERIVNVAPQMISPRSKLRWFNPRTGKDQSATEVHLDAITHEVSTPTNGDWVLIISQTR